MTIHTKRILSILLAALAAVSLAACGGGGGGSTTASSPGGGSTPPSAALAACTDPNYDTSTYSGIAPCVTVTGLTSGQSVTVSDGSATLTETANGTYTFPGLANGSEQGVAVNPTVTFSVTATTGGATCSLAGGGATAGQAPSATAYAPSALCAKYPAVSPGLPKITTMPGASGTAQVIASPTIVPVYISTGSLATGNESNDATFLSQLVSSQEWGLLSQYGVGAATVDAAVTVNPGSWSQYHTVTAADLSTIAQGVAAQGVTLTPSSVLVIYLPPTVTVSPTVSGGTGYTGTVASGSTAVPFALVTDDNVNDVAYVPNSSVYWEAEAGIVNDVTDANGNGYAWMSANPDLWLGTSVDYDSGVDGEYASGAVSIGVGTVCLEADGGIMQAPDISTGDIVSIWSQTDANAGRNPCQPNADFYDNSQPNPTVTLSDSSTPFVGIVLTQGATAVTGTLAGISRTDQAIVVAPGQSVTVQAQVFTTAAVQDMQAGVGVISYINAEGVTSQGMQSGQPRITVSAVKNLTRPSATGVNNGDTLEFTVTASATPFKGMYVLTVELGSESVATPIGVTNGTTWQ
jgi:hypothetical protein